MPRAKKALALVEDVPNVSDLPTDRELDTVAFDPANGCPVCKSRMVKRNSARGAFWGCSAYPKCKTTYPIPPTILTTLPAEHPAQNQSLDDIIDRQMKVLLLGGLDPKEMVAALGVAVDWQKVKWLKENKGWGEGLGTGTMRGGGFQTNGT